MSSLRFPPPWSVDGGVDADAEARLAGVRGRPGGAARISAEVLRWTRPRGKTSRQTPRPLRCYAASSALFAIYCATARL